MHANQLVILLFCAAKSARIDSSSLGDHWLADADSNTVGGDSRLVPNYLFACSVACAHNMPNGYPHALDRLHLSHYRLGGLAFLP